MSKSMDAEYIIRSRVDELVNPKGVCWVCHEDGLHQICSDTFEKERDERKFETQEKVRLYEEKKLKVYSITGAFGLRDNASRITYEKARFLVESIVDGKHAYDESKIVEGKSFWFVPYFFIGLTGYIVDKNSSKVFALGSGLGDMWVGIEMYLNGKLAPETHNKALKKDADNNSAS